MSGFYDNPPNFGFVQSSLPGLPTTLDEINPSYYQQISNFIAANGGRLASITGVELYDTLRIDAGTLPVKDFVFFQNALGQQQQLFISGTSYTKQEIDVSPWIVGGGQLAKGYEALIWQITVQFSIVAGNGTVQPPGVNFVDLALNPGAPAADINLGGYMRAFQESTYFFLYVNNTRFEDGPGWRFPAGPYGISGEVGGQSCGWANNGVGWAYQMPVMRHLPELTRFGVHMKMQNPFVLAAGMSVRIKVGLCGIGVMPVTG
ncbi:MAG: hypothetical protein J2P41_00195 [Blastocatellia bacterium]|nr:hypothetical protein [Blastocatellia bacterium]